MEKEKVTEELVRQNGNQSAMVMADYASQGGGGSTVGGSKGVYGSLVDLFDLPCFKPGNEWPEEEEVALSEILADGYALLHWTSMDSLEAGFYIVKVTGSNPSIQLISGQPVLTDCEPVTLDLPLWAAERPVFVQANRTLILDDISKEDPLVEDFVTLEKEDLPVFGYLDAFTEAPLLIGALYGEDSSYVVIKTDVNTRTVTPG